MAKLIKHRSIGKIRMELVDYVMNVKNDSNRIVAFIAMNQYARNIFLR